MGQGNPPIRVRKIAAHKLHQNDIVSIIDEERLKVDEAATIALRDALRRKKP
jgi:hypothetical protein